MPHGKDRGTASSQQPEKTEELTPTGLEQLNPMNDHMPGLGSESSQTTLEMTMAQTNPTVTALRVTLRQRAQGGHTWIPDLQKLYDNRCLIS